MRKETGFNLLELMAAVAIAGVVLAFALPNYQDMVKNNCMTAGANSLASSFQQARSEAVKRGTNVTITAGNPSAGANEWGAGWTVTLDEDRNNNGTLDTGEDYDGDGAVDNAALVRNVSLTCTQTTIDEPADETAIVYGSDGFVDISATFNICDDRTGETGRQLTLSLTGRPTMNSQYNGCP